MVWLGGDGLAGEGVWGGRMDRVCDGTCKWSGVLPAYLRRATLGAKDRLADNGPSIAENGGRRGGERE